MTLIVFSINPSIILIYPFSSGEQKEKAIPDFPALPVLPILCIYVSGMFGMSKLIMASTLIMSIPRAATSVAIRIVAFWFLKSSIALFRILCVLSP